LVQRKNLFSINRLDVGERKNGIKIFTKYQPISGYKIIRAVFTVPESVAACLALIKDSPSANLWMNRVIKFETIEEKSSYEWFTYGELDIPWPFDNKDFISHNTVAYDEKTQSVTVKIKSKPDFIPPKKGKHRVKESEGVWYFVPTSNGTEVCYEIFAAPDGAGILPAWMFNSLVVASIYESMEGMIKLLQTQKYRSASISF